MAATVPAIEQEYSLPEQQLVTVVALTGLTPTPLSIAYDWCYMNLTPGDLVKVTISFSFRFLHWFEAGPSFATVQGPAACKGETCLGEENLVKLEVGSRKSRRTTTTRKKQQQTKEET